MAEEQPTREQWATRIGLILAMVGNAVGLGNFLRFPVQAAQNGGGAFMIPYLIALLFLGIPLMWVEWSIGRFGGRFGHGSTPGMFARLWSHPSAKYLGALGVAIPICFGIYYVYVESWTLGYSLFSLTGKYFGIETREAMGAFLSGYQGIKSNTYFSSVATAYIFFVITVAINTFIIARGLVKGIETLAKIAMPLLFLFSVILVIRVFTLGTPDPAYPERNVLAGLAFIWNPDLSQLFNSQVWLAAAGQIFFTLGIGIGVMQTYASYLGEKRDIALAGLATSATNEFSEIVLGGSIAIPIAVAFFGLVETRAIAQGGAYDLGFQAMPIIFQKIPWGQFFGGIWFLLLFFAGITSSVALAQPVMAFLQDELGIKRVKAALIIGATYLLCGQAVIFFFKYGFLSEMDFWAGTFGLVFFAVVEIILFVWVYGMDNAWQEITTGAAITVPKVFYYIIKYISPLYLLSLLVAWGYQWAIPVFLMDPTKSPLRSFHEVPENSPYLWGARILMGTIFVLTLWLVRLAWSRRAEADRAEG